MSRFVVRGWAVALLAATVLTGPVGAQQRVAFDSLDHDATGQPVRLTGDWFAAGPARAPAVVLLHGCGGAYDRSGRLGARMRDYAALLSAEGIHALVLDSLGPRGEREICTQRTGTRQVTMINRRRDTLAAIDWLAARPDVSAERIGLIGWSNGGSTVLASTNLVQPEVAKATRLPAFAVAFYPGCEADLKRGYRAAAPLLLMVGEADDWTPAEPCRQLAAKAGGAPVRFEAFAGAYHGFDGEAPVRLRRDVPNGVRPGEGVHVGGQPEARERSRALLLDFLRRPR
jgi:dienelactone hydrolase